MNCLLTVLSCMLLQTQRIFQQREADLSEMLTKLIAHTRTLVAPTKTSSHADDRAMSQAAPAHIADWSDTLTQHLRHSPDWQKFNALPQRLNGGMNLSHQADTLWQLMFATAADVAPASAGVIAVMEC